jgi:hypothetical protein
MLSIIGARRPSCGNDQRDILGLWTLRLPATDPETMAPMMACVF